MKNRADRIIFWAPRILAMLFTAFLSLFSLDVLDMGLSLRETAVGLLMHNIPSLVLLAVLIVSWKHEIVGGVVFILAGTAYVAGLLVTILANSPRQWYMLSWAPSIAGPAFLIGILFTVGWYKKRKGPGPKRP